MDIRNLDLNLLKTLHVLLEELNVGRAALRLSLSQSAVSHALSKLRIHFNDPLLIKIKDGMAPTALAQELKIPLSGIMEQIRDLTHEEEIDPAVEKMTFRISASDYGAGIILPRLMEKMSVSAPHCSIDCSLVSDHLEHDLRLGRIDLAFGGYKPFDHYSYETLFDDRYVGVVRSGHPLLDREIQKETITAFPHAYIAVSANTRRKDELYKSLGINSGHVLLREPYFLAAPLIVEKSDLILIMPEMGAKVMARIIDVTLFDLPTEIRTFPFIQVWHRRRDNDKMHQWFRSEVKDVCSNIKHFLNPPITVSKKG
ncbi:MAG: LysR family transcriptional regulator [Desulfobacteraceae bacterium]|nr:LysR family transcriptional regulator [Desulfobacteraceae bacterium]